MKYKFLLFFSLILSLAATAQDFTGQWNGEFTDKSTSFRGFGGDQCDYVLDIECKGDSVTGSSYTYFTDGGKKYYTICRLEGFIKRKQQYIEVREVERTKTNVPVTIRNCFQVHKLTYFKHGDSTTLQGNWVPAPNQNGDCGYGTTLLSRRELKSIIPKYSNSTAKVSPEKKAVAGTKKTLATKPAKTIAPPIAKKDIPKPIKPTAPVVVAKPVTKKPAPTSKGTVKAPSIAKTPLPKTDKNIAKKEAIAPPASANLMLREEPDSVMTPPVRFEKRSNTVLQTIEVKNKTVKVDLYDNGEVDGDSISLFYNGKLLMSSKRLSEKPITLNITVEDDLVNELVMYAENLGTIPPNTALMVVTDGRKRYEVRITSDLEKSGVINFVHNPAQN
ncbi:MAG: hypothetical protein QM737_21545 [Ferruginibacter sp.]